MKRTKHTPEEKTVAPVLCVPPGSTQEAPRGPLLTDKTRQKAMRSHVEHLVSQQTGKETKTRCLKRRDDKWMN